MCSAPWKPTTILQWSCCKDIMWYSDVVFFKSEIVFPFLQQLVFVVFVTLWQHGCRANAGMLCLWFGASRSVSRSARPSMTSSGPLEKNGRESYSAIIQ